MQFRPLQSGNWYSTTPGDAEVQLLAFGSYLEFSVDGRVILTLVDDTFNEGLFGFYLESAKMRLHDIELRCMREPKQSTDHLVTG